MPALKPMSKYSEGSWGLSVQVRVAGIFTGTAISPSEGSWGLSVQVRVAGIFTGTAISPSPGRRQFPGGDSAEVVTRFVQVGTYPTRNFATLGPL